MGNELEEVITRWDRAAARFDQRPGHGVRTAAEKKAWTDLFLRTVANSCRILDVGTGTGEMALLLAGLGHRVIGIDLSEKMLERAREKARESGLPVEFKSGDAENLRFDDASLDAVLCRHLLWQLYNPEKALQEWVRVLKPGGTLLSIEGRWRGGSVREKARHFIANIFLFILEKRTRWRLRGMGRTGRPLCGGVDAEQAATFFRNAGLVNVTIDDLQAVREAEHEHMTWMERVAYPVSRYMIVGSKKSD